MVSNMFQHSGAKIRRQSLVVHMHSRLLAVKEHSQKKQIHVVRLLNEDIGQERIAGEKFAYRRKTLLVQRDTMRLMRRGNSRIPIPSTSVAAPGWRT
jgi:hypothetical protein